MSITAAKWQFHRLNRNFYVSSLSKNNGCVITVMRSATDKKKKKIELFTILPSCSFWTPPCLFSLDIRLGACIDHAARRTSVLPRVSQVPHSGAQNVPLDDVKRKRRNTFPPAQWPQAWVHTPRGRVQVCPPPVGDTVVSHTAGSSESKVMWWVSNSGVTWKCEGDETSSLTVTDYNATEGAANIGYNNLHTLSLPTPEGCITER